MISEKEATTSLRMRDLVQKKDWAATPLGPAAKWPQSLKTVVELCLASKFPTIIFWGPERVQIYNDAYRPILGATKHPQALGQRAQDCWAEIWQPIGPMMASVFDTGQAVWLEDSRFSVERHGYLEEFFVTFTYAPIRDESGSVGGIFETVVEVTTQILALRRLAALRELGEQTAAQTVEEACANAAATLAKHPYDLPFALLYLLSEDNQTAVLRGHAGIEPGLAASPRTVFLGGGFLGAADHWRLLEALGSNRPVVLRELESRLGHLPGGPWPESTHTTVVLPIEHPGARHPFGFFVAGISPRRALDDAYYDFLRLAVQQLSRSLSTADAYQQERKRAEKLAEIDRAKTAFFNNVSHEFRTPLTLILGPVEEALAQPASSLQGKGLEAVHRSAVRLLRLVNSLLDFARIEAGRHQTKFAPTDLSAFTADLASSFRSLVEPAGLKLTVDCPSLPELVYVDASHWEKIVLNLMSNAFKFTLEGGIVVSLAWCSDHVELTVSDTGCGIPERELPRMFERFHRVEGARGRSFEGTGIGLSLVHEFVKLHGGIVRVSSVEGRGSTFVVSLPAGCAHLPPEHVVEHHQPSAANPEGTSYLLEAMQWLGDESPAAPAPPAGVERPAPVGDPGTARPERARVLVADDNADMRGYLARILSARWHVDTADDGEAALKRARAQPPDLILSDVMMPKLDGLALLRELRRDPLTREIPVVLLSARAGEESLLAGIETGADDYLVKPFSARELLARVQTHLGMAQRRRRWARELEAANKELEAFSYSVSHDLRTPLRAVDGFSKTLIDEYGPQLDDQARRYLGRVRSATQRMGSLIDDLLNLSRISRASLRLERVDMTGMATKVLSELKEREPGRKLESFVSPDLYADADPHLLEVMLDNLLGKAWKFTGKQPEARIEVGKTHEDGVEAFFVRDNGAGFDMEHVRRLFTPFQRLHPASEFEGTGIGLATVQRIVTRHGGRIWARAARGEGATFFFTLRG